MAQLLVENLPHIKGNPMTKYQTWSCILSHVFSQETCSMVFPLKSIIIKNDGNSFERFLYKWPTLYALPIKISHAMFPLSVKWLQKYSWISLWLATHFYLTLGNLSLLKMFNKLTTFTYQWAYGTSNVQGT